MLSFLFPVLYFLHKYIFDYISPRIQYSSCSCSVAEKPDVMVLAPVMVLAFMSWLKAQCGRLVVDEEADEVVDEVTDM